MLFMRILHGLRASYRGAQRRFAAKVLRRGPDDCWPWLGFCSGRNERRSGCPREPYGKLRINGRNILAHRWALFGVAVFYRNDKALHTCDNSLCCNPSHLYAGTLSQNLQDALGRGRIGRSRGTFVKTLPPIGDMIHSSLDVASVAGEPVMVRDGWHVANSNDADIK